MTDEGTKRTPYQAAWSRREALRLLGIAGATTLAGQWPAQALSAADAQRAGPPLDCVVTPEQTEGPYFVDERLHRADLRIDPTTKKAKQGLPLRLRINVSRVDGRSCSPLPGAFVDVWQCDALGVYSDFRDFNGLFDTRGQKFLRGYQVTDRSGAVEFATIYPGWYRGRAVHIHVKVRFLDNAKRNQEFTSQLYFDDAITDQVHARSPYKAKGPRDTRNDRDHIFRTRDSGSGLLLRLRPHGQGYLGTFAVGLIGRT